MVVNKIHWYRIVNNNQKKKAHRKNDLGFEEQGKNMNKVKKLLYKLFCGVFGSTASFHPHFCELKLMDFYCTPVVTIA